MEIQKYLVHENQSIESAVAVIKQSFSRCCVVVNDERKVLGVFSDGDVLGAIQGGMDLHTPLCNVVTGQFLFLKKRDLKHAFELFRDKGITLLPVVDDDYILQDVVTIHDVLERLELRGEA